jgi:HK97 family phage major capsid protein
MLKLKNILAKIEKGESLTDAEIAFLKEKGYDKDGNEVHVAAFAKKDVKGTLKENIGKVVRMEFSVEKVKELSNGLLRAVISSETEDRHGEKINMQGMDLKKYMTNPIMAPFHQYDAVSVGRTHKLTKTKDGKLIADFEFATDIEGYQLPKILDQAYRKMYQFAFSIGFIPKDVDGNEYTKAEMIEFSPVLIGANDEALLLSFAKAKGLLPADNSSTGEQPKKGAKMLKLKEILAKIASGEALTDEEKAFLVEKQAELTEGQVALCVEAGHLEAKDADEEDADDADDADDSTAELEKTVKSLTKSVNAIAKSMTKVVARKDINTGAGKSTNGDLSKEEKLKLYYKGLVNGDFSEYMEKSAMNTSDDSQILPPEEFIAEVSRLEEEYGVAARYARVRRTTRPTMRGIKGGTSDVEFVETAEGIVKPSQAVSYLPYELTFRKFAAIVPVTDELLEDSAIDLWNDLTGRFARAAAKKEDQLVFTDATTGILNTSGTAEIEVGGDSFLDITADDLNEMMYAVPTPSRERGRFYLNPSILGVIQRLKDLDGRYIWRPGVDGGAEATIWGKPYSLTEILPDTSEDEAGAGFVVFGDLQNTDLGIRVPMQLKFFDAGVVGDPDDGDDLNLITQDIQAVRARVRMNAVHKHANAYSVLVTTNGS